MTLSLASRLSPRLFRSFTGITRWFCLPLALTLLRRTGLCWGWLPVGFRLRHSFSIRVLSFHIWVIGSELLLDFVALLIHEPRPGLVLGLEFGIALSLQSLHLLLVQQISVLIPILDLLLPPEDACFSIRMRRNSRRGVRRGDPNVRSRCSIAKLKWEWRAVFGILPSLAHVHPYRYQ